VCGGARPGSTRRLRGDGRTSLSRRGPCRCIDPASTPWIQFLNHTLNSVQNHRSPCGSTRGLDLFVGVP